MTPRLLALGALLFSAPAFAQDGPFSTSGDLRWIGTLQDDFEVDAEGTTPGQRAWLSQRVRAGLVASFGAWGFEVEGDALTGQLAGDTWSLGDVDLKLRDQHAALGWRGLRARKALVRGVVGDVLLEGGLTTSHWGLGLLANDGAHDTLFGRTDFGNTVLRGRATWMPSSQAPGRTQSTLTGAVDLVMNDGIADIWQEQYAFQAIVAGLQSTARGGEHGFYTVFRQQWFRREERTLTVGVFDVYADHPVSLGDWTLRLRGEALAIVGSTDRATTYNSPIRTGVFQYGASGQATLVAPGEQFRFHVLAGTASSDGTPDGRWNGEFSMHPDFNVGLVLFDQLQAGIDAQTLPLLSDPMTTPKPPDGADVLVRDGSVHGVTYLQPVVQLEPATGFDLRLGTVLAWSNAAYAHPYYSFRNGGVPTNAWDQPTSSRYLGTELNWGLGYGRDVYKGLTPSFDLQGGHLFTGGALAGGPQYIHHLMAVARVQW